MPSARQWSVLAAAVAQAAVPALGYLGLLGKTVDSQTQTIKTPLVPADYAFTIWGLIFLFALVYAVDQFRPTEAARPLYQRIGWLTAVGYFANAIWSVVAQLEISLPLTGIIFLATFASMLPAAIMVADDPSPPRPAVLAVGSLAAWVTIAIYANWSVIAEDAGLGTFPLAASIVNFVLLFAAATTAALMIVRTRGDFVYAATIAWAAVGLSVGNFQRGSSVFAAISSALLIALSALAVRQRRRRIASNEPGRR